MGLLLNFFVYSRQNAPSTEIKNAVGRNDWQSVERLAAKSLVKSPKDRTSSLLLTMSLMRQEKLPQALASAQRTVAIDSSLMQAWLIVSECQSKLALTKESISTLLETQRRFPDSLQPTWALGMTYARAGKCADAITPLEEIMFRRPDVLGVVQQLAQCYFTTQRYAEAVDLFGRVVERDPNNANIQRLYAEALLANKLFDSAVSHIREAIRLNPKEPGAYLILSGALQELNKTDEALAASKRVTVIAPHDPMGWYNVGLLHLALNQHDSAIRAFKQCVSLRPNYPEAYFNLGLAYEHRGFQEDAIISLKRCASLSPLLAPDAYNSLAIMYRKEGRFEEAVAVHGEAIALRDTSISLRVSRINTYYEAEKCGLGQAVVNAELLRFPNEPEILYSAGRCLLRTGNVARVEAILIKLDALSPFWAEQLRSIIKI